MKKIFTLFALISVAILKAQGPSLEAWVVDAAGTTTLLSIPNGAVISGGITTPSLTTEIKVKFKNISATTNTYSVIRTDIMVNAGAAPSFCFGDIGTCYSTWALEANVGDYSQLAPGAESAPGKQLVTDLLEGTSVGYSEVYYKLFNVATGKTGADTLSFTIKYNMLAGVHEHRSILANVSNVYPNPSSGNTYVTVVLTDETNVKVQVYSTLGTLVYNGSEQHLSGKNNLSIDCTNLNSGLYFVTVTAGNSKVTKRLVLNK